MKINRMKRISQIKLNQRAFIYSYLLNFATKNAAYRGMTVEDRKVALQENYSKWKDKVGDFIPDVFDFISSEEYKELVEF